MRDVTRVTCPALLVLALACGSGTATLDVPSLGDAGAARPRTVREEEACAMQTTRAERGTVKQVDIVFVVDNSGSMTDEIDAVRRHVNDDFAAIIAQSGVDYRVILLSQYGREGTNICIDPPLAGAGCDDGLSATNSDVFFHYDLEIDSVNSWCALLESFDEPDQVGRAPDGWQAWLRPDAEKAFVVISDDSAFCTYDDGTELRTFGGARSDPFESALAFHEALLARAPEQFGVPPDIRYRWYSIVGMAPHDEPTEPWFPHEDVVDLICDTGASAGQPYQALSIVTDALRYPVCEGRGFDALFQVLARGVIEVSKADCVFDVPEPPEGQGIDLLTVSVEYRAGDGETRRFEPVADPARCDADSFTIAADHIELCPAACRLVEADDEAEIDVHYACVLVPE